MKRILLSLALSAALAAPAWARGALTLQAAVDQAAAQNPGIRAAEARIEAAQAREVQAGVLPNPNLTATVDQVPFSSPGSGNYMAGVSQPLLLGGQREARREAARLDREAAELDLATLRRDLAGQVREAYAGILFEEAAVGLARSDRDSAAALAKAAQALVKAGEVPPVDALRATVESSRARRNLEAAEGRLRKARARLNVLVGCEASSPLTVAELPSPEAQTLPPVEALVPQGLASRVELRQADVAIARESAQRRVAQTSLWTGSEISVLGGAVGGMGPGFSTTLTVPIPLYRQQGEIAEAEANRRRAEAERDALRNTITLEIEEAYRDALNARAQVLEFRKSYLPEAERLADNARRRFLAGEGGSVDAIEARRALTDVRTQYQQTILDYRRAIATLERAVGQDLTAR